MLALRLIDVQKLFVTRTLFKQVSAGIKYGEKIGLVGPNGVGKTTLLNILTGEIQADAGTVRWDRGIDRERIGSLTQQVVCEPGETVRDYVRGARPGLLNLELQLRGLEAGLQELISGEIDPTLTRYGTLQERFEAEGGYLFPAQVDRVLHEVGLPEAVWNTKLAQASGGQKTRAQLARMLLQEPQVMLLDEPTNHLDAKTMDWLEGVLSRFEGTVIIVSHDRYFLDRVATRILELSPTGLASYPGHYTAYVEQKELERRAQELMYHKQQGEMRHLTEQISMYNKWYHLAHDAAGQSNFARAAAKVHVRRRKSKEIQLERIQENQVRKPMDEQTISIRFDEGQRIGNRAFLLDAVAVRFGERELYRDISLTVERGQRLALVGPNGIGKSTLLKVITGELEPSAGAVKSSPAVRIGYFGQEVDRLHPDKTILEEVLEVEGLSQTEARTLLACFLFRGEEVFKKIATLSQGEKCRVAFVKMYFSAANVLVLDEPTNYLDIQARERIETALQNYPGTVLLVSHDRYMVQKLATHLLLFEEGGTNQPAQVTHFPASWQEWVASRELRSRRADEAQKSERRLLLQMELSMLSERMSDPHVKPALREAIRAELSRVQEGLRM